ncbi:TPA: tyrosine-type recombinase/integrase [Enterococcus faecalis]
MRTKEMISVKDLGGIGFPQKTAKTLVADAKEVLVTSGNNFYDNRKIQQVPANILEDFLGTPVTKENFVTAKDLVQIGISKNQSKEAIRKIKHQLSQEYTFYSNPKVTFVPRIEAESYLGQTIDTTQKKSHSLLNKTEKISPEPRTQKSKIKNQTRKKKYQYVYTRTDNKTNTEVIYYEVHLGKDSITGKRIKLKGCRDRNGNKFRTLKDAYLEAMDIKLQYERSNTKINPHSTFSELMKQSYLPYYKQKVKPQTFQSRDSIFKLLLNRFGKEKLMNISREKIQHYKQYLLNGTPFSQNYSHSILSNLHTILKFALNYDYIDKNNAEGISIPKEYKAVTVWEYEEFKKVHNSLNISKLGNHLLHTIMQVFYHTGVRVNEGFGLQWQDIDFKEKTLSIWGTLIKINGENRCKQDTPKTKSSIRLIKLDDITLEILKSWKKRQQAEGINSSFIFSTTGIPIDAQKMNLKLKEISKKVNVEPITLGKFRHSYATHAINVLGCSIEVVSQSMGHASITTTQRYYVQTPKIVGESIATEATEFDQRNSQ